MQLITSTLVNISQATSLFRPTNFFQRLSKHFQSVVEGHLQKLENEDEDSRVGEWEGLLPPFRFKLLEK